MTEQQMKALNDRVRSEQGENECVHGTKLKDCNHCFTKTVNDLVQRSEKDNATS